MPKIILSQDLKITFKQNRTCMKNTVRISLVSSTLWWMILCSFCQIISLKSCTFRLLFKICKLFFFQKLSQFKSNMPSVHHYYQLFKVKKGLHKLKPVCDYLNLKSCSLGNCNSDIDVLSSSILSLEPLVTPNLLAIRAP